MKIVSHLLQRKNLVGIGLICTLTLMMMAAGGFIFQATAKADDIKAGYNTMPDTLPDANYSLCVRGVANGCPHVVAPSSDDCKANHVHQRQSTGDWIWGCDGINASYSYVFYDLLSSHQYITLSNNSINDEVVKDPSASYRYAHTIEFKIYTATPSDKPVSISIVNRGIDDQYACHNHLTAFYYSGNESQYSNSNLVGTPTTINNGDVTNSQCEHTFTFGKDFPSGDFTLVPGTGINGSTPIYEGRVVLFFGKSTETTQTPNKSNPAGSQSSFHVTVGSAKLGYLGYNDEHCFDHGVPNDTKNQPPVLYNSPNNGSASYCPGSVTDPPKWPEHAWTNNYPTNLSYENKMRFYFKPQCTTPTGTRFNLQWDDVNEGDAEYQPSNVTATLYKYVPGTNPGDGTVVGVYNSLGIHYETRQTGNGQYLKTENYGSNNDQPYAYMMEFTNVNGGNGISFHYPFDSGLAFIPCPPPVPPTGTLSIMCENNKWIPFKVSGKDVSQPSSEVPYQIFRQNPGNGDTLVLSGTTDKDGTDGRHDYFSNNYTFILKIQDLDTGAWTTVASQSLGNANCPPPSPGSCYQASPANNGGTSSARTRALYYINSNPVRSGKVGWTGDTPNSGSVNASDPVSYFPAENPDQDLNYKSAKTTVRIYAQAQTLVNHPSGGQNHYQWENTGSPFDYTTPHCFRATCSLIDVVDNSWPRRPGNNTVRTGDTFTARVRLTNNDPNPEGQPPGGQPLPLKATAYGHNLSLTSSEADSSGRKDHPLNADVDGLGTQSSIMSINFTVSGGARSAPYTITPYYNDWTDISTQNCDFSVNVYEQFSTSVHAQTTMHPTTENPSQIDYHSWLKNESGPAANVPIISSFYKRGGTTFDLKNGNYSATGTTDVLNGNIGPDKIGTIHAGDTYCTDISAASYTDGWVGAGGAGDVTDTSTRPGNESDSSCPFVHNEPYVNFFGSDVSAGGGFNSKTTPVCKLTKGGIQTYMKAPAGVKTAGSGVQIGALSIGKINGFTSATLLAGGDSTRPTGPTGLSFSNTENLSGSDHKQGLGGNLYADVPDSQDGIHCVSDYMSSVLAPVDGNTGSSISLAGNASAVKYYKPAGGKLNLSVGDLANGVNIAVYVDGDVTLGTTDAPVGTGNIRYASNTWDTSDNIPSFRLIARNIYIQNSVRQLDGLYVAQPKDDGSQGNINTCASDTGAYTPANLLTNCLSQLVVNGAFVAKHINLDRSWGSLRDSYQGEHPGTATRLCSDSGNTGLDSCAGEIFNFSPEVFFFRPPSDCATASGICVKPSNGPTTGYFDYITSLPPVL